MPHPSMHGAGCCDCGTSDDNIPLPDCACTSWPPTVHLTNSGPCGTGIFPDATITYGPPPAGCEATFSGSNAFLSEETFTDEFSESPYKLGVFCDGVLVRLRRLYLDTCSLDAVIYTWSIGQPGNTCVPFSMTSGTIYPGGNSLCHVLLNG